MMPVGEQLPGWPIEDRADWNTACKLLEAGQYEPVAQILGRLAEQSKRRGDVSAAMIIAAAQRICLACSQCRAEAEWHQDAYQEADRQEGELRQQLYGILSLVRNPEMDERQEEKIGATSFPRVGREIPGPDVPEATKGPGLWHHIQSRLRRLRAPLTGHAQTVVAVSSTGIKQQKAAPSLVVYCLGPFRVYQDEKLINNWPSGKGKCIFKYMIANRDRPIAKEVLMDLIWRDADPDAARNNLNVAIYGLRQAFRVDQPDFSHILFQDDCYLLNPVIEVWVDAEEFLRRYEAGRALDKRGELAEAMREYEIAESLYQGDFLEEDLYQDWPVARRQNLKDSYLNILDRLSRHYLEKKRYAACIRLCQRILSEDNCQEEAHRRLMRCYSRQGQRNLALRQYSLCVETLYKDLEVMPMDQTVSLYQQIRNGESV